MKQEMTFEQAAQQLEQILQQMADEHTPLEESMKLYAQAAEHLEFCDSRLRSARLRIVEIDEQYGLPSQQESEEKHEV